MRSKDEEVQLATAMIVAIRRKSLLTKSLCRKKDYAHPQLSARLECSNAGRGQLRGEKVVYAKKKVGWLLGNSGAAGSALVGARRLALLHYRRDRKSYVQYIYVHTTNRT